MSKKKTINKVTTDNLSAALKLADVNLDIKTIDIIIDMVELLEKKGSKATLKDIDKVKNVHDCHYILYPNLSESEFEKTFNKILYPNLSKSI